MLTVAVLASCGGQDTQQPAPTPTLEETAAPASATATPGKQAAGGDPGEGAPSATEDPADHPAAATPDPAHLQYLREVCLADAASVNTVVLRGTTSQRHSDSVDEPGGYERMNVEPVRREMRALRAISPPGDLAVYHESAVANYEELLGVYEATLEAIEGGATADEASARFGSYFVGGPRGPTPPLPPQLRDRLAEAAAKVPECEDSSSLFFFLGVHVGGPAVAVDPADEAYLRSLCIAFNRFAMVVYEASTVLEPASEIDRSDVEAYYVAALEASAHLVAGMRAIQPPADVADYQAAYVERLEDEAALLDREEMVAELYRILQAAAAGEEIAPEDLARLQPQQQEPLTPALSSSQRERLLVTMPYVVECYNNFSLYQFLGVLDDLLNFPEDERAAAEAEEIPVGGSVEGTLDTPDEEDTWWFQGEEGETYLVTTAWEDSPSLITHVAIDDRGNRSIGGAGTAPPVLLEWTARKTGPVYVKVHSSETARETVSYTVSVLLDRAPKPPTNARYVVDGSAIRISWDAVAGADYYNLYYSDSSDPYCRLSRDRSPAFCDELATNVAETTYLHADPDGEQNHYWVAACNSAGCSGIDSRAPAVPSDATSR